MKKTIILCALLTAICFLATGCKLSTVEYNDAVVVILDQNSKTIESTVTAYNESIPDLVTEESEIDASNMISALDIAKITISDSEELLLLEGGNEEQQLAVREEFANYLKLASAYLEKYEEMTKYYESHTYKESPELVSTYDAELFDNDNLFDSFLESNNLLAEILESFL